MNIFFRTDASLQIGTGHVMRCLTLANALRERGAECHFVSRAHPGHLGTRIEANGHRLTLLPMGDPGSRAPSGSPSHTDWLGAEWKQDAEGTISALGNSKPNWLVVDHYALDTAWESDLRSHVQRIMVIDDLADRRHDADLLLDQNFGRQKSDYANLVTSQCTLLIGSRYALLRPEFARLREYSLARRHHPQLKRLLISMGGVDPDNATGQILETLQDTPLSADCRILVIMGGQAPWLNAIRKQAARCRWPCEVRVDVNDMARIMADSDLAIGAAGSTSWERCALGLPTIAVMIAENQRVICEELSRIGAHWCAGRLQAQDLKERIRSMLVHTVADPLSTASLSARSSDICDSAGTLRLVRHLNQPRVVLRPAAMADAETLFAWRNHPNTRCHFFNPEPLRFAEHVDWLKRSLDMSSRVILVAESDSEAVGCVRVDITGADAEVSIYLDPAKVGRGLGIGVLVAFKTYMTQNFPGTVRRLTAKVKPGNGASLRAFLKSGFQIDHEVLSLNMQ